MNTFFDRKKALVAIAAVGLALFAFLGVGSTTVTSVGPIDRRVRAVQWVPEGDPPAPDATPPPVVEAVRTLNIDCGTQGRMACDGDACALLVTMPKTRWARFKFAVRRPSMMASQVAGVPFEATACGWSVHRFSEGMEMTRIHAERLDAESGLEWVCVATHRRRDALGIAAQDAVVAAALSACDEMLDWGDHFAGKDAEQLTIWVAARDLPEGRVLTREDLRATTLHLRMARDGLFLARVDLIGRQLKGRVPAGFPLEADQLAGSEGG